MLSTTQLSLIGAVSVFALLTLAWLAYRGAQKAQATGYDLGYNDAKRGHDLRVAALHEDVERLHYKATNTEAAHRLEREAIMQDADRRIAIYAARALTAEDVAALRIVNKQLLLAVQTYSNLHMDEQARFANTAAQRFGLVIDRVAASLTADLAPKENILVIAANAIPNGKSWLVHGPQACGKTRNARAIADALGLPEILDDWQPGMPVPTTKTLVLTNAEGPFPPFTRRVLSFEQAMSLVASKQEAAA